MRAVGRCRNGLLHIGLLPLVVLLSAPSARAQVWPLLAAPAARGAIPTGWAAPGILDSERIEPVAQSKPTRLTEETGFRAKLWQISMATLATANAVDMVSSWKKRELNPALAQSSGAFGCHAALLKMGIVSAVMGVEYLVMRHRAHPDLYRTSSIINFCMAGTVGAVAGHNYHRSRLARKQPGGRLPSE